MEPVVRAKRIIGLCKVKALIGYNNSFHSLQKKLVPFLSPWAPAKKQLLVVSFEIRRRTSRENSLAELSIAAGPTLQLNYYTMSHRYVYLVHCNKIKIHPKEKFHLEISRFYLYNNLIWLLCMRLFILSSSFISLLALIHVLAVDAPPLLINYLFYHL